MIGYDNFGLNFNLILDLPMREMSGLLAYDRSKGHVPFTLQGPPTWNTLAGSGIPYLNLAAGVPDWLECPAAYTEYDFTTEDFSMAVWLNVNIIGNLTVMCRGLANTDGWLWIVQNTGRVGFATCQAGLTQTTFSAAGDIVAGNWYLVGITRADASVLIYINAVESTDAPDVHVDPLTSARKLHIGILDDEFTNGWDGFLYRPRIWDNRVLSEDDWERLFELERGLVGL